MATKYLRSSASGSADGSTMVNAYTTMATAVAALGAGDTLLIASDHNESPAADQTFSFANSTVTAPNIVLSVDPVTENYSAGALLSTAGNFNITFNGWFVMEGVNVSVGVGATTARSLQILSSTSRTAILRNCTLTTPAVLNSRVSLGQNGGAVVFDNVTVANANANGWTSSGGGLFIWKNSTCYTGTAPTYLSNNGSSGVITYDGCDISNVTTIRQTNTGISAQITLRNCKLSASLTMFSANSVRADSISIVNCSTSSGATMRGEHGYSGGTTLNAAIYRTGGASDGVASYSNRVFVAASGAQSGASRFWPQYSLDVAFNVAAADVGIAKTLTAYLLGTNAAGSAGVTLGANDAWLEVDYLGDGTSLDSAFATSGPPNGKTNGIAPVADSASAWTATGLTSPIRQSVSRSFTPAKAGMHRARVALARADTQVFVDPKLVLA